MRNTMNSGIPKALRNIVAERDSYTCVLCHDAYTDVHHIVPRSLGGRNSPYNLVCLCRAHHMLVHRTIAIVGTMDFAECEYAIVEYIAEYYAHQSWEEFELFLEHSASYNRPSVMADALRRMNEIMGLMGK